ncbi:MAG: TspO/MBR family protein [Acidobacteriota bacterium]
MCDLLRINRSTINRWQAQGKFPAACSERPKLWRYDTLKKPWFQPPGWVFSPAWTVIFALLAVATWQVAQRGDAAARTALWLYGVQLVLNVAWSLFFFALQNPAWALADVIVLDAVVVTMVVVYGRIHRAAGWLLVPYAVWLGLATAINIWIVVHN